MSVSSGHAFLGAERAELPCHCRVTAVSLGGPLHYTYLSKCCFWDPPQPCHCRVTWASSLPCPPLDPALREMCPLKPGRLAPLSSPAKPIADAAGVFKRGNMATTEGRIPGIERVETMPSLVLLAFIFECAHPQFPVACIPFICTLVHPGWVEWASLGFI